MSVWTNVEDVGNYFRKLCGEPDLSFLSNEDAARYLNSGHEEFRRFVTNLDVLMFTTRRLITLSDVVKFDTNTLSPRPIYITGVYRVAVGDVDEIVQPLIQMNSIAELFQNSYGWVWDGALLRFSGPKTGDYALESVDEVAATIWTAANLLPGPNQVIESTSLLREFYDLIALMAAEKFYLILDDPHGKGWARIRKVVEDRKLEIRRYLYSRSRQGSKRVGRVASWRSGL